MTSKTLGSLRLAVLGPLALVCLGCPNPQTYTTPRTVGSGNFSHSIAAEGWGFSVPTTDSAGTTTTVTGTIPTFPTYTLRIGISDQFEIGARIANMSSLGVDLKFNFLRSPLFDLAIDPAAQVFAIGSSDSSTGSSSSVRVVYLHAPVLAGINLSRGFSLVLAPGVTYGIVSGTVSSSEGRDSASATTGVIGRFGVGFDIRVSPGFAVHPEITFLRTFSSDATMIYMVGVGFNFGTLPTYDDVGGGATPPPPPPPGAPPPYAPPPADSAPPPPPPPS